MTARMKNGIDCVGLYLCSFCIMFNLVHTLIVSYDYVNRCSCCKIYGGFLFIKFSSGLCNFLIKF